MLGSADFLGEVFWGRLGQRGDEADAPALARGNQFARPTHACRPATIGCSTPTSSVNRVLIMSPSVSRRECGTF